MTKEGAKLHPLVIFYDSEAAHGNVYRGDIIEIAARCHPDVVKGSFQTLINTNQPLCAFGKWTPLIKFIAVRCWKSTLSASFWLFLLLRNCLRGRALSFYLLTAIMASKGLFKLGKALMFGKTESALAVSLKSVIHGLVIVCIAWQWYRNGSHAKKVQRRAKLLFLPFYLLLNTILSWILSRSAERTSLNVQTA